MDYEQKYKEALKKAQKELQCCGDFDCDAARQIYRLFPELKKSEDERIKEEIIDFLQLPHPQFIGKRNHKKWIAWLEKQGEQKPSWSENDEYQFNTILHGLNLKREIYKKEGNKAEEDRYNTQYNWLKSLKYRIKEVNNTEPKFKVGDWITNGDYTWKIVEIKPLDYILQSQNGNIVDDTISHVDTNFSLWTIEDAKDCDVLAFKDGTSGILIYKECTENFGVLSYCRIVRNSFIDKEESGWGLTLLSPATKEQRDFLFQKMKEAGYTLDAEKKHLTKNV